MYAPVIIFIYIHIKHILVPFSQCNPKLTRDFATSSTDWSVLSIRFCVTKRRLRQIDFHLYAALDISVVLRRWAAVHDQLRDLESGDAFALLPHFRWMSVVHGYPTLAVKTASEMIYTVQLYSIQSNAGYRAFPVTAARNCRKACMPQNVTSTPLCVYSEVSQGFPVPSNDFYRNFHSLLSFLDTYIVLFSYFIAVIYVLPLVLQFSVGIAGGLGGSTPPPVHFFNPPSLIYSFVLGGVRK